MVSFGYACPMNLEHFLVTLPGLFWICVITPGLLALGGVFLSRMLIGPNYRQQHHTIAQAVLGPIASMFGIMAAFIVATTWSQYSATRLHLNEESDSLRCLYLDAQAFSPEFCKSTRSLYRLYREAVLYHEWKIIHHGEDTLFGDEVLRKLSNLFTSYSVKNDKEFVYFDLSVHNLAKIKMLRHQRLDDSSSTLLPLLWMLFLLGGTTLVFVSFLMVSSVGRSHGAMVMLLAMVIGLMIYAIISLDLPFVGPAKISNHQFQSLHLEED